MLIRDSPSDALGRCASEAEQRQPMPRIHRLGIVLIALAAIVAAFVLLQPDEDPQATATAAAASAPAATAAVAAPTVATTRKAPAPAKPPLLTAGKVRSTPSHSETVRFRVRSSVAEEVHVHGYRPRRTSRRAGRDGVVPRHARGRLRGRARALRHPDRVVARRPVRRLALLVAAACAATGALQRPRRRTGSPAGPTSRCQDGWPGWGHGPSGARDLLRRPRHAVEHAEARGAPSSRPAARSARARRRVRRDRRGPVRGPRLRGLRGQPGRDRERAPHLRLRRVLGRAGPAQRAALGDVFRAFNPWRAVRPRTAGWRGGTPYPERLGHVACCVGLAAFGWLELGGQAPSEDPYSLLAAAALAVRRRAARGDGRRCGVDAWSARGDAFGVYFGLFARFSPLAVIDGRARPPPARSQRSHASSGRDAAVRRPRVARRSASRPSTARRRGPLWGRRASGSAGRSSAPGRTSASAPRPPPGSPRRSAWCRSSGSSQASPASACAASDGRARPVRDRSRSLLRAQPRADRPGLRRRALLLDAGLPGPGRHRAGLRSAGLRP